MNTAELRRLLSGSRPAAVQEMSRNPTKAAHRVPACLIQSGYDVIRVNPFADEILGLPCYASLMDAPGSVDIVDVFRPSEDALAVVEETVRRHRELGDVSLTGLQLDTVSRDVQGLAAEVGIPFVQDRCMVVEIPLLFPQELSIETGV